MRHLNRIQPMGDALSYKTFQILQPLATHFRPATCAEVDCAAYRNGWQTVIDESTELGLRQAHYITHESGRRYVREPMNSDGFVTYTFEAGQQCFRQHRESLERDPIHIVRDGDWRVSLNPQQLNGDDWVDKFANHQDQLKTRLERG